MQWHPIADFPERPGRAVRIRDRVALAAAAADPRDDRSYRRHRQRVPGHGHRAAGPLRIRRRGAGRIPHRRRPVRFPAGNAAAARLCEGAEAGEDIPMKTRLLIVILLLAAGSVAVRTVGHGEPVGLSRPFWQYPSELGGWSGYDVRLTQAVTERAGVSSYMYRVFGRQQTRLPVHLYV